MFMSRWSIGGWVVALAVVGILVGCSDERASEHSTEEHEEEHAELAQYMARLQRWTHKTALSVQAQNPELSEFYLHEMEESIETIRTEVPRYEGHEIGRLMTDQLGPSVEALDQAVEARDWSVIEARLQDLERSCNQCHESTEHGFVRIDLEDVPNPYTQDFSASPPAEGQGDS
jgi:tetrahydromethanopterin S-methyltransferase subunit G